MPSEIRIPILENDSQDGWPVTCDLKIINPGVVHYDDLRNSNGELMSGEILADKQFLDRIAGTLKGKPIVNWDHRPVRPGEFDKGSVQGIITTPAVFNAADGYYHAEALIWNTSTLNNIKRGFSISCAYKVSDWRGAGEHNKVPYANAANDGEYTHVAVVPTPRYEGAKIELLNSDKGGSMRGLLSFFRQDKQEEKIEIDPTAVTVDGVSLAELKNSYEEIKAKERSASLSLKDDDLVEVGGVKVSVRELRNAHKSKMENTFKEEHEDGKHKDEPKENCAMCNSDDEEKEKEKERKNTESEDEKKRKEEEERKNSVANKKAREEAAVNAAKLDEARNAGGSIEMPKITSLAELMAEGESRYGAGQTPTTTGK